MIVLTSCVSKNLGIFEMINKCLFTASPFCFYHPQASPLNIVANLVFWFKKKTKPLENGKQTSDTIIDMYVFTTCCYCLHTSVAPFM